MIRRVRYIIFLRDIAGLACTSFGGAQAHLGYFISTLVKKRGYLSEEEFLELYALCQMLPGPTSTQTITAIGYRVGGPNLAYLTLLVWMLPAVVVMTSAGFLVNYFSERGIDLSFTRFIQPMAVAFIIVAAIMLSKKVIHGWLTLAIAVFSLFVSIIYPSPFTYPMVLLVGGAATALNYKKQPQEEKFGFKVNWSNFVLWAAFWIAAALAGHFTGMKAFKLLENFYRNGSLIFGGGHVLIPYMYTEFVEFKAYLTGPEFLSGYGLVQAVPGPVFSFTAYVGLLSMREFGVGGELAGAFIAAIGIFLPGTFLIFFVVRFWDQLKKYRVVRASLQGIQAASTGIVISAVFLLVDFTDLSPAYLIVIVSGVVLLLFSRIPAPILVLIALGAGFLF